MGHAQWNGISFKFGDTASVETLVSRFAGQEHDLVRTFQDVKSKTGADLIVTPENHRFLMSGLSWLWPK